ncbi:hypothetical protein HMN09_01292200 [Mycena chlorophos]|uniref:Uncharacterized protein n=1 Tax=Mycena chlorophos TaxID=658473 RepID=A0A8H6VQI3_MYCCL|nr:hypothetical protein HMN09_01292200 [Mycena chlorophos]
MYATSISELPIAPDAEDPSSDFFLSYPYLLVWTDQVDLWRLSEGKPTHVCLLEEHIDKPRSHSPIFDAKNNILVIAEPYHVPTRLRVYALHSGDHLRDIQLYADLAGFDFEYRPSDGHVLVLLSEDNSPAYPRGRTAIVDVDLLDGVVLHERTLYLPPELSERETSCGDPQLVLTPVFFGAGDDVVATSTTKWLGKLDLLSWGTNNRDGDDAEPTQTIEFVSGLSRCDSMVALRHLAVDEHSFVLCTHECRYYEGVGYTSVRRIAVPGLSILWEAAPIPGDLHAAETLAYLPALGLLLETVVAVLDAETGEQRAVDSIESDIQQDWVIDVHVSADEDPVLCVFWRRGEVLLVRLQEFIESGFPRESVANGKRVQAQAVFPADVISVGVGRREAVAIAGVRKYSVDSRRGSDEWPDWDEEDGTVVLARW